RFVFEQTNVILGLGDPEYVPPGSNVVAAALGAGKALADLMLDLSRRPRDAARQDLTSALLDAGLGDETLTPAELASFFVLLVVAGNETTRNAISHGMRALCDHPDERRRWQADFEGVAPLAVEEIVRWATPVIHFRRTATRDTQLAGQPIAAGEKVGMWYCPGNRDEAAVPDPFRFDLPRPPNHHAGF